MNIRFKIFLLIITIVIAGSYFFLRSLIFVDSLVILLGLSVVLLFIFMNKLLRQTNWYKNQFLDSEKFHKEFPHDIEICNLGSNSGKFAFAYNDTIVKGENWAVGPQSFSYDFQVLKNYFSYLKDGGIVLITMCPLGSCLRDYPGEQVNIKYYPILDSSLIVNYSHIINLRYVHYPVLSTPMAIRFLIRDVPSDDRLLLSTNPMNSEEIEQDADNWINGWKNQFSIPDLNSEIVSKENQSAIEYNTKLLSDMIDFCIVRNLKPILVLPPVTKSLRSKFSEIFLELYVYSFIRNANSRNIKVLDYFDDIRFMDSDLYFNSFFMNSKGRKLFTNYVLKDIQLS